MKSRKENFEIRGYFYNKSGYSFRKYLNIKRINSQKKNPDLMVVMMNPGSSKQEKEFINIFDNEVPTIPDNTQHQIMRVMNNTGFDYARILNLSDLREPKSKILYDKINELDKLKISHSIFQNENKTDLKKLFVEDVPVICAWGVNENLRPLARLALKKIKNETIIGLRKNIIEYAYYHPLPQNYTKQKEWVKIICEKLAL